MELLNESASQGIQTSLMKIAQTIVAIKPNEPVTKVGSAKGKALKNLTSPKSLGYCFAGSASVPPRIGPRKRPRLPANAKKLKARACVLGVEFSESIVRIVLGTGQHHRLERVGAWFTVSIGLGSGLTRWYRQTRQKNTVGGSSAIWSD